MRKLLLFIIMIAGTISLIAQNITIDQLITLRTKSLASVEELLVSKKWELLDITDPSENTKGIATFAYGKSSYDDKANSFIKLFFEEATNKSNRISLQVASSASYNAVLNRIKVIGFTLKSTKVNEGVLEKVYVGKGLTIKVTTGTQKDDFATKWKIHAN